MSGRRPPVVSTLSERDPGLVELMDDPACDRDALFGTYAAFSHVNALLAGWRRTYRERLRPNFTGPEHSVVDIGAGGGDVARALIGWARRDGVRLEITAIDPDERAAAYVSTLPPLDGYTHRLGTSSDLADEGRRFDFVLSNHVLHHLGPTELGTVLADSEQLARRGVVHSDIRRSATAYALYSVFTAGRFRGTFIREDGLLSIRRSHRVAELAAAVPVGWRVVPQAPHRLLLMHDPRAGR